MIQSMTGYGKSVAEHNGKKIIVEVKSLNSRQLDLSVKVPVAYREKELLVRNEVLRALERGKVDFGIFIENISEETSLLMNKDLISAYKKQIDLLSTELGIEQPKDWFSILLKMPEVFKQSAPTSDDAEWEKIADAIKDALAQLVAFRKQEGVALENVFNEKLNNISSYLEEIKKYEAERVDKISNRLRENLQKIDVEFDKNRFEQELIFYIEKLDISEEKTRLTNHLKYFRETMKNEVCQGKKLGFIAQEMGREINTMGSKSNHSEMQILVVKMKDELEQIKEQVLNVL
ncbi:MAG: YicC family protein [Paludibacteraceae bacterium]|nr:YicC family protein [Paludibacteraceae bacterium]MBO7315903.1 YicC family protein [Paludibacteraceae bacterium]